MLLIKKNSTPQRFRNFIAKLPVEYQLNINGKRCIAMKDYPSKDLENILFPSHIILDMDNVHDIESLAFRIKYAKFCGKTELFSAVDLMKEYAENGFLKEWALLWFEDITSIEYGW